MQLVRQAIASSWLRVEAEIPRPHGKPNPHSFQAGRKAASSFTNGRHSKVIYSVCIVDTTELSFGHDSMTNADAMPCPCLLFWPCEFTVGLRYL